jgi:hypothetical protein
MADNKQLHSNRVPDFQISTHADAEDAQGDNAAYGAVRDYSSYKTK